jgi:hypothetical protein
MTVLLADDASTLGAQRLSSISKLLIHTLYSTGGSVKNPEYVFTG